MKAKDLLPDNLDERVFDGVAVRKGTVGAFLINARSFRDPSVSQVIRSAAERDILDALPLLQALGLFDIMEIRDERLRSLIETGLASSDRK